MSAPASTAPVVARGPERPGGVRRRRLAFAGFALALGAGVLLSIAVGARPLSWDELVAALLAPGAGEAAAIVWELRVPRTVTGIAVGIAYGVAGALMQALTRNPLADPGILGVNAGAGLAVTLGVGLLGLTGVGGYQWFAFAGAVGATLLVLAIGSAGRGPASPVQLVLAGVALGAVMGGVAQFLSLIDPDTFEAVRSWGLGSIARANLADTAAVAPALAAGLVLAVATAGALNALALGDETATSLGASVVRTRVTAIVAITLLAGGATALTGGLAFVGLMVPHIVRWATGPDQRRILAGTVLAAPALVLLADVLGRVIARPGEIEVGILTAVLGAPVLIALVRRRSASAL